jgi:hypothetical protein
MIRQGQEGQHVACRDLPGFEVAAIEAMIQEASGNPTSVTGIPLEKLGLYVLPFLIPLMVALLLVIVFPQLSLWLPRLVLG